MGLALTAVIVAAALNAALLVGLLYAWVGSYREVGASHTLGLILFGVVLLVENVLWLYFYGVHDSFRSWFLATGAAGKGGTLALCGLELIALAVMVYITWN